MRVAVATMFHGAVVGRVPSLPMALDLQPGDTYDRFRIDRVIRRFPHAGLYDVATHQGPAMLKLSREPVQTEEIARRALREVAVLERVTNTHVVGVLETGMGSGDHWYILMEHLDGAPFDEWHNHARALPATDAARLVHEACLGMAELHTAGIVHRNLGPEAMWVTPDQTLKILDFSFARSWGEGAAGDNVTIGLKVLGSPRYTAPELIKGGLTGPATDIYALGLLLYELLSGYNPYFADEPLTALLPRLAENPGQWMRSHVSRPLVPLNKYPHTANLPPKLVELVNTCLAKDPAKRVPDAATLANSLGALLHDLGATAAAVLRVEVPGQRARYQMLTPGSHRLGAGPDVDVAVLDGPPREVGVLDWAGAPHLAEWVAKAPVEVNHWTMTGRVTIGAGDQLALEGATLSVAYPAGVAAERG